jgi:hypothetical protein
VLIVVYFVIVIGAVKVPSGRVARFVSTDRAGCNIRRGIGHSEEDNDFPAWLALESATLFLHRLTAGWAQRFHWIIEMPETWMA